MNLGEIATVFYFKSFGAINRNPDKLFSECGFLPHGTICRHSDPVCRDLARESSVRDLTNGQSEPYYDPKGTRASSD